jgi:hypothetical protein
LVGLHGLDFATDAGDFLFDLEDVFNFSGALSKDIPEALFCLSRVLQARDKIGMLLGDFLAGLLFPLDASNCSEVG